MYQPVIEPELSVATRIVFRVSGDVSVNVILPLLAVKDVGDMRVGSAKSVKSVGTINEKDTKSLVVNVPAGGSLSLIFVKVLPVYVYTTEALADIEANSIAQKHTEPNMRDFFISGSL